MSRIALLFTLLPAIAFAQQPVVPCGYDHWFAHQKQNHREYADAITQVITNWKSAERGGGGGVLVLPVVFHVVYNTDAQNITDDVIASQLEVLNEDYRRLNETAVDTRPEFLPVAADCEIEFALANVDPDGNPTTGITHTFTERSGFTLDLFSQTNTLDEVKKSATGGVDAWDTEHYINVWICNIEAGFLGQIFGLAYPPAPLDNWPAGSNAPDPTLEGVIVHYTTVGRNNPQADDDGFEGNDLGRTLVHEMGHYLGLRHTWGDALPFFEDGCEVDDGMEDTPNTATGDQFACDLSSNSCETDLPGDLPDQIENYMDYTPDACLNMFTNDQKDLMRFVVFNLRPGLLDGVLVNERIIPAGTLFPNPAADQFAVRFDHRVRGTLEVRDCTGRMMDEFLIDGFEASTDCSHYPSGVYTIAMRNSKIAPLRLAVQ